MERRKIKIDVQGVSRSRRCILASSILFLSTLDQIYFMWSKGDLSALELSFVCLETKLIA